MAAHFKAHGGSGTVKIEADISYLAQVEFEPRTVRCITTGKLYENAVSACSDFGISWYRMARHLKGEISSLRTHSKGKTQFEYTDLTWEK